MNESWALKNKVYYFQYSDIWVKVLNEYKSVKTLTRLLHDPNELLT